ncbi:helix-turn-helix domain-containing protein [Pirellulimonas nuda]|uniref:helix-turn-helix domain-containing protein n=1 Tax=Pirellulimonas nuda TaxID=2528009 RepID=UPI0011A31986|nr:helix-turn-helix domain-containing protein [Pirellulimonas nuda]
MPSKKRRVALTLAAGESTGDAARRFGVSPARISGLRRELAEGWRAFTAEPVAA